MNPKTRKKIKTSSMRAMMPTIPPELRTLRLLLLP
jgi:hypothetical protein